MQQRKDNGKARIWICWKHACLLRDARLQKAQLFTCLLALSLLFICMGLIRIAGSRPVSSRMWLSRDVNSTSIIVNSEEPLVYLSDEMVPMYEVSDVQCSKLFDGDRVAQQQAQLANRLVKR